jgi:hypothetical protein
LKNKVKNKDQTLIAVIFHIGLGIVAFLYRPIMMIYLLALIPYFFLRIVNSKPNDKVKEVLIACAYIAGAEVFFRMTKAYILYETGKYLVIFFIIVGLIYNGFKRKAYPYILFLLLLIPAVMVSFENISYDVNFRKAVLFNLSGPLCLSFVALFTYGKTLSYKEFLNVLNFIVYPLISMTVYIILYRPDLRDVITNTAANTAASGGFGPNQVATTLGLGVFILFSRIFIPYTNRIVHFMMMFFLAAMTYRGILTFSRGGVLTSLIMCVSFLLIILLFTSLKSKVSSIFKVLGILGVISIIWTLSIMQTGGLIENRYANKDALGREKQDVTTGRIALITTEFNTFKTHPFFGVGVGQVKGYFIKELGVKLPTHNEVTRMLSEHGIFGIFALLILIIVPVSNNPMGIKNIYFYPLLLFWFLTISHSSMRIAASAFIYGLSLLTITREKNSLYRK